MKYTLMDKSGLAEIEPLWEKLNALHYEDSEHFKDRFRLMTFDKRCEEFSGIDEGDFRLEIIEVDQEIVGYCVSTVRTEYGEIDSLYVEPEYRRYGYGKQLILNGVNWLKERGCNRIHLTVAGGHESVLPFYQKLGFYPETIRLTLGYL